MKTFFLIFAAFLTTSFAGALQTVCVTAFCVGPDGKETSSSIKELVFDPSTSTNCSLPLNLPDGKPIVVSFKYQSPTELFVALQDPSIILQTNTYTCPLNFVEGTFPYQTGKWINVITNSFYTIELLFSTASKRIGIE